jgi:hypothetical protein
MFSEGGGGAYGSFIEGLNFVAAVTWEANYENPGRFVAAHFLVPHSLKSCPHPFGVPFFLRVVCNILERRRISSQGTDFIIWVVHIRLFKPTHNRQKQVREEWVEKQRNLKLY